MSIILSVRTNVEKARKLFMTLKLNMTLKHLMKFKLKKKIPRIILLIYFYYKV